MNRKNSNPTLIQCALRGGVTTTVPVNLPEALQPPKIHNPIFKQRAAVNNIVYSINHPKTTHVPYLVYRTENSQFLPNPLLKSSPGVSQRLNDCYPPFHPCTQTKNKQTKTTIVIPNHSRKIVYFGQKKDVAFFFFCGRRPKMDVSDPNAGLPKKCFIRCLPNACCECLYRIPNISL